MGARRKRRRKRREKELRVPALWVLEETKVTAPRKRAAELPMLNSQFSPHHSSRGPAEKNLSQKPPVKQANIFFSVRLIPTVPRNIGVRVRLTEVFAEYRFNSKYWKKSLELI